VKAMSSDGTSIFYGRNQGYFVVVGPKWFIITPNLFFKEHHTKHKSKKGLPAVLNNWFF
jgi:hypothetical protein